MLSLCCWHFFRGIHSTKFTHIYKMLLVCRCANTKIEEQDVALEPRNSSWRVFKPNTRFLCRHAATCQELESKRDTVD